MGALGSGGGMAQNGGYTQPAGHYITVKDPDAQAQIRANNAIIADYNNLSSQLTPLKSAVEECKKGLDCCYENACLSVPNIDFGKIATHADAMKTESENLAAYIKNIAAEISKLEAENAILDQKTVQQWVPD